VAEGEPDHLLESRVALDKSETMTPRFWVGVGGGGRVETLDACMWMYVAWLQKEKWVPIRWSVANSYGLGPVVQGLYGLTMAKRCLNSCEGSSWRQMKWVRTLCRCSSWLGDHIQVTNKGQILFFHVYQRREPLTSPPKTPYSSVSVLMSDYGRWKSE
jgi:hypothetical protein